MKARKLKVCINMDNDWMFPMNFIPHLGALKKGTCMEKWVDVSYSGIRAKGP